MSWLQDLKGAVFFLLLALLLAYGTYQTVGVMLDTEIPVVAVVSNSMSHALHRECAVIDAAEQNCQRYANTWEICGEQAQSHTAISFSDFWRFCGDFYEQRNITESQFQQFPLSSGFQRGDLLIVRGETDYAVGDVVVYTLPSDVPPNNERCRAFVSQLSGIGKVVHRIVDKTDNGYITKGDHNDKVDGCVLEKEQLSGKVVFSVPKIGYLKILPAEIVSRLLSII